MPELILLSLSHHLVNATHRAACDGDGAAVDEFDRLWDDYRGRDLACFICDQQIDYFAPFTMLLPEPSSRDKLIGAPLCAECRDLPQMVRWHRCLKLLRQMHKAQTGKQAHFNLVLRNR